MRLDLRVLLPPVLAALVLFMTLRQTSEALERSGAWQRRAKPTARPADPYAVLDGQIARPHLTVDPNVLRDPFAFGSTPRPVLRSHRPAPGPIVPVRPAVPVLTSITWSGDTDPRATLRYNGRDYSLGVNALFDEFRVRSITRNQVVLERNGEPVVLTLRSKGE